VGDHGCEYMTGGTVLVLGMTGKNFGAGMSGGVAYVLDDERASLKDRCNADGLVLSRLSDDDADVVRGLLDEHIDLTRSDWARQLRAAWPDTVKRLVKVTSLEYQRVTAAARTTPSTPSSIGQRA